MISILVALREARHRCSALSLGLTIAFMLPLCTAAQDLGSDQQEGPEADARQQAEPVNPATPGPMDLLIAFSRSQLAQQGFEKHQAEVEGQSMTWWSQGSGPSLVLLHGVNDQAGTWFQITAKLTPHYRVLLPDLPGHGESAPSAGPLPMSTVVGGLHAWLDEHVLTDDGPVTLVGNSMGAWLAVLTARELPQQVSRIVLTNGGPLAIDNASVDLLPKDREEARQLMSLLRHPSFPLPPDVMLDDLVRRAPNSQAARMLAAAADLENHLLDPAALAQVTTSADLLWGKADRYLGLDYPQQLDELLPASRLEWMKRCGHIPQVECPGEYGNLLLEILRRDPPEPTVPLSKNEPQIDDAQNGAAQNGAAQNQAASP